MADIQAAGEIIKWAVNGVTILLMIIAASLAIKKTMCHHTLKGVVCKGTCF